MERIKISRPLDEEIFPGTFEARVRIINGVKYDFQRYFRENGEAYEIIAARLSDLKIVHYWTK